MTAAAGGGRRYLVVLGVVAVWMAVGIAFRLNPDAYLLVGVPLLLFFQLGIAGRPISELWFKHPSGTPLPAWGWLAAAAFMATPVYYLVHGWSALGWSERAWMLCAAIGAIPLAYSLARFSRSAVRPLLLCLGTAGVLSILVMGVGAVLRHHAAGAPAHPGRWHSPWVVGLRSFLLYLPVGFVLEEVFFRGGLDSYVDRPGQGHPLLSATFVSVLWGLWHLPSVLERISATPQAVENPVVVFVMVLGGVTLLPLVHCISGIPFSLCWRRSGLLFVPAAVHALIDAVRNLLLAWH